MGLDSALSRDAEFHELERQELITGEPRYTEDEVRNTSVATILAAVAALLSLVGLILVWVLYSRHRNDTFLTHGIIMIAVCAFAIVCIPWALGANRALKVGKQPSSLFTLIIFLLALAALGYCILMAMWITFYRPIHYDYLVGVYAAGKQNDRLPNGWSFDDVWRQDRRLMYWVITFTLIPAFCFGFIAYTASNVVWNKYQLVRYGLYFALAIMTLAAWLMLFWTSESYEKQGFIQNDDAINLLKAHKTIAIVALAVAFVNMIVNVIKSKIGYFIFGILATGLLVILIAVNSPLWRQVRREQFQEVNDGANVNCQITEYSVHESDLNDWCGYLGGKYLPNGQTCGKVNLVTRWETGNSEIRSLNPACCLYAKHVNIWPFYSLAFWGLLLILSTALSMITNFYLADTTEYLANANRALGIGDYLGILAIVGLSIAWGIYFIVRGKHNKDDMYTRSQYINSYNDPNNNIVPGWPLVPAGLLAQTNPNPISQPVTASICFPYDTATLPFPSFQTTGAACTDPNTCTIRLALSLLNGATFQIGNIGTASRAFSDNRFVFFPQCALVMTDFLMFYGTQQQIRTVLQNIQICPQTVSTLPVLQVYTDQVNSATIQNSGLVPGEVSTSAAANANTGLCGAGFSAASCATSAICRFRSQLTSQVLSRTLKGRFYYITQGQKRFDVPNTIGFVASDATTNIGGLSQLFNDGVFSISNIPLYLSGPYRLRLTITDSSNTFLSSVEDILIDPSFGTDQISAGEIRLNTRDGNVCLPFINAACIASQQTLRGSINVVVQEGGTPQANQNFNPRLADATVRLMLNHVITGATIAQINSDFNGVASFSNQAYNSYTIIASKTGYNPTAQYVNLQSPTLNPAPLTLIPTVTNFDTKVVAQMVNPATDYDLLVQMRNINNNECEVSPYNKYCPYSYFLNDVTAGPGEEDVIIKRLSVATYNALVRQSPPYNVNCDATTFVRANAYHLSALDWGHTQGSQQIKITPGSVTGMTVFGGNRNGFSFEELLLASLSPAPIVESNQEAQRLKTVIRVNNSALSSSQQYTANSYFIDSDKSSSINGTNPNNNPPINPPITYITCASPPPGALNCLNGTANVVIPPANTSVIITNYTLNNSNLESNISNQTNKTNFTNNQSVLTVNLILNNTLNKTDNTRVNGTFINTTMITPIPNGTNFTNVTSTNVTMYTNGTNTTETDIDFSINDSNGTNTTYNRSIVNLTNTSGNNNLSVDNVSNVTSNGIFAYSDIIGPLGFSDAIINSSQATPLLKGNTSLVNNMTNFSSPSANNTTTQYFALQGNFNNGLTVNYTLVNSTSSANNTTSANISIFNSSTTNYSTFYIVNDTLNASYNLAQDWIVTSRNRTVNISYFNNSTAYYSQATNTGNFSNTTINFSNYTNTNIASNNTSNSGVYFNISSNNSSRLQSFNGANQTTAMESIILQEIKNGSAVLNYSVNYTTPEGNYTWCNVTNNSLFQVRSNLTSFILINVSQICNFTNGTIVNKTNQTYIENSTLSGSPTYRNNSNVTWLFTYPNGTTATFSQSFTLPAPSSRRLLQQHQQTTPTVITAGSIGGNFLWIACFTGFGRASVIRINNLQDIQPTLDNCIARINSEKPNFTVQKLNDAVRTFSS